MLGRAAQSAGDIRVETAMHDGDTPAASARERALVAKQREVAAHARAIELHEQAAELQERLGHPDRAANAREHAAHARELHERALAEQADQESRTVVGGGHVPG